MKHCQIIAKLLLLALVCAGQPTVPLDAAKPLVVMIEGGTKGTGIVFHVDAQRRAWILTANHVVRPGGTAVAKPTVRFFGTVDDVAATLRSEKSEDNDLAVLTAPAPAGVTFPFGLIGEVEKLGERASVRAIGYPGSRRWGATLTASPVSDVSLMQISVETSLITNGYSGGPLVDAAGRVVGMVQSTGQAEAQALRIDRAVELLRRDLKLTVSLRSAPAPVLGGAARPVPVEPPVPFEPKAGTAWTNPKDGLVYRWIPKGRFRMGCDAADCEADEKPVHTVNFPTGFWIGETEVTQEAYTRVARKASPSKFKGPRRPVENVDWNEASAYCRMVDMRLPTEAEWEYASRAGTPGQTYGRLKEIAWYDSDTSAGTQEVGTLSPNAWGLRDTLGNVEEWVADWYGEKSYSTSPARFPKGPTTGRERVVRGGSMASMIPESVTVSNRYSEFPTYRGYVGFRCAGEAR
jgi:formylglycine-generating enzyme